MSLEKTSSADLHRLYNIRMPPIPDKHASQISVSQNPSNSNLSTRSSRNPFTSSAGSSLRNPFSSVEDTASSYAPSSVAFSKFGNARRYFYSRRKRKEDIEKPWTQRKDPREIWQTLFPLIGLIIGLGLSAFLVWDGLHSIEDLEFCPIYLDNFTSPDLNTKVWTREVEVGGFGNGQFEETTGTDENSFIKDNMLWLKPTLQDEALINNNYTLNLTARGTCTSDVWYNCVSTTNTTNNTIVNPVKSARLNTRLGASIKYGKVEVVAQMPSGDWMWPAIWMMPMNNTYGAWPASGEIDMAELRGNNYTYPFGGNNIVHSTLHWGPDLNNDAWYQTNALNKALHSTYASEFHTYGLIWTEKYLFTYLDTQLLQVLYTKFSKPLWEKGNFPGSYPNGTQVVDPWAGAESSNATPFDQPFYLILDIAVGATNGWFADDQANKPWDDASPITRKQFWNARDEWYPTWAQNGQMKVKSVKMWQLKGYQGC